MCSAKASVVYRSNRNVVYSCNYQIAARLKSILRELAAEHQAVVLELEVMPDHGSVVHLRPSWFASAPSAITCTFFVKWIRNMEFINSFGK